MLSLDEVKAYLRVTYEDDDPYIKNLIEIAEDYLHDGISDYEAKKVSQRFLRKAKMVKLAIIQQLYDERYYVGQSKLSEDYKLNYVILSMIFQLENGDFSGEDHV